MNKPLSQYGVGYLTCQTDIKVYNIEYAEGMLVTLSFMDSIDKDYLIGYRGAITDHKHKE